MWNPDGRRVNGIECIWYLPLEVGMQMTSEEAMKWLETIMPYALEDGLVKARRRMTQEEWDTATNLGWEY